MDNIAKHQMTHFLRIDAGTSHRLAHNNRCQINRCNLLKGATVITNCCSNSAQNDNFPHVCSLSMEEIHDFSATDYCW